MSGRTLQLLFGGSSSCRCSTDPQSPTTLASHAAAGRGPGSFDMCSPWM
jgi:hypothetical protein